MDIITPVRDFDEYTGLIEEARAKLGKLRTNCPLFPDAINRHIRLGRLYCENIESGVMFYTDEEHYYQGYFHLVPGMSFSLEKKDKPVVLQNIYREGKRGWLEDLVPSLERSGFHLSNIMRHGTFTGYDNIPKFRIMMRQINRIFDKEGLTLQPVSREQVPEMLSFISTIKEIPFYEIPYYTTEEYGIEAKEGRLNCVTDRDGKIIAARHFIVAGKKAYGWIGIREKYRKFYGIHQAFLNHDFDYMEQNEVKFCSWVDINNKTSLQNHNTRGTNWDPTLMDVWIL